jgi:drug/metabolite transporter (DMT)-like permease
VPTLLALCAALAFGAGDFFGGQAVRRAPALGAVCVAQVAGLTLLLLSAPWTVPHAPDGATLAWSIAAGLTGAVAALTLYPALALGSASEVAPLSAVIGTALPILFGVALGERPSASAWAGIALAVATIVLVSSDGGARNTDRGNTAQRRRALALAAVSGVFIGAFLIAFERAGAEQGLLPLVVARSTSVPLFALALLLRRERPWPARVSPAPALAAGVFDVAANGFYLFALASAPLSLVATLSNLYPAFTVLLGVVLLGDRPRALQQLGLVLGLAAIVLITR